MCDGCGVCVFGVCLVCVLVVFLVCLVWCVSVVCGV